jgi:hypothetical protein
VKVARIATVRLQYGVGLTSHVGVEFYDDMMLHGSSRSRYFTMQKIVVDFNTRFSRDHSLGSTNGL